MSEQHECTMLFDQVDFSNLRPGELVWHNIICSKDKWLQGPFTVGGGRTIINSSGVVIPVVLFGPDVIWYQPFNADNHQLHARHTDHA